MTIRKSDLPIPSPCDADWDAMHDRGTRRFCDHCTKDVHDLSTLTREEALALLERRDGNLCVRYAHANDEIFFKDSTSPVWRLSRQLEGAKKLLAAAALVVPMLAACEPTTPQSTKPVAVTPISVDSERASLKPGAGIAPTFGETVEVKKAPVEEVEVEMGEPPMHEEEVAVEMGNEVRQVHELKGDLPARRHDESPTHEDQ